VSGKPILLLHGQPGSGRDWDRVVSSLGQRAKAIAIDRPGWDGHSRATTLAGNAQAAVAALDAHGIRRATVVGHSFGGAVAAWLAAHHPDRVAALVLAAPAANPASLQAIDRWLAAPVLGYIASATALTVAGGVLIAGPLRRRIERKLSVDDRYLKTAAVRLISPAAWRSFVLEQRVLIHDLPVLEQQLERISAPTTILTGSRDEVVPLESLQLLATQIPGAELVILDHAGHLLPLRHAEQVAANILSAVI